MNRFKCKDKHKCEYTYKKAEKIVPKEMKAWNYVTLSAVEETPIRLVF